MFNKPKKGLDKIREKICGSEKVVSKPEKTLLELIGQENLPKWHSLKMQLSCKTDEEFMIRLLAIAQEYVYRNLSSSKDSLLEPAKKRTIRHPYNKNKLTLVPNGKVNPSENKNEEIDQSKNFESDDSKQVRKPDNNIGGQSTSYYKETSQIPDCNEEQLKTNTIEENNFVKENVDKIKIKSCQYCNTHHLEGNCPIEFPHYVITDALDRNEWIKKYKSLHDKQFSDDSGDNVADNTNNEAYKYSYSVISLPDCLSLSIVQDDFRVFAKKDIEPFTQFGPLAGKLVKEKDIPEDIEMKYIWEAVESQGNTYFNTENTSLSNWVRYIRPAPEKEKKNIVVISKEKKLYFNTVKFIRNGEELLYWQYCSLPTGKKKMEKSACGGCNVEFHHPLYYRIHCSLFHDVRYSLTIKKYHCKICGLAVLGKENIMKHAAELHNGQGAYQCQFCKKFFLRLNYLEMHRTYGCSANPHRSVPLCDFCGKKFCQPQKLKVHIKRMHSDLSEVIKEFQCKDCKKILGSRAALQRHSKEVHQKQTDGQCLKCGKKFQNKSNLKIHMLTHSGIKPFRCATANCHAAFTTKQCLQFHYKKVHNYIEDNMPKIERSVDYTFQAYSGSSETEKDDGETSQELIDNSQEKGSESENESISNENSDNIPIQTDDQSQDPKENNSEENDAFPGSSIKVLTKGSKKWISDESANTNQLSGIYSVERLSKETFPAASLPEADIYNRNKLANINDYNRHDASNASLLVEAALNSVCNEPELDIDVSTAPNCSDSLVNNLYSLTQPDNLPDVAFTEGDCINDSRHITLISPSITDHVSVTDDLKDEMNDNEKIDLNYSSFAQEAFSPPNSPDEHRVNFVRNYINSLSPPNPNYSVEKNSVVPSPPRFDIGHGVSTDRLPYDDDVLSVQNLSIHSKNTIHMDLHSYKLSYKISSQDFRRLKFEVNNQEPSNIQPNDLAKELDSHAHSKYSEDLPTDVRHKFDVDLDTRLRIYDSSEAENMRQKSHIYESSDPDFRNKAYDVIDSSENRKQYDIDSEFRIERNFEPLIINSSELQGLDMSARSFHNYPNLNRYHHLYPELDRIDLRLNYSPPPSTYTHADILRVSSLDLTSPGRHSVDLSLRNHSLHQIANSRLLTEHTLSSNNRLLDQNCLISSDLSSNRHLTSDRIIPECGGRILTDHSTPRFLNDPLSASNHLINSDQRLISEDPRLTSEQARLLDQRGLISESRLLTSVARSRSTSPVQGFNGYSISQNHYHHSTTMAARTHVSSPSSTPYHYSSYY